MANWNILDSDYNNIVLLIPYVFAWGVTFSKFGDYLFIAGRVPDGIYRSTLTTPWDITTAVQDQSLSVDDPRGAYVRKDGLRLFTVWGDNIQAWQLTTPNDLTTATSLAVVNLETLVPNTIAPTDVDFSSDGMYCFIASYPQGAITPGNRNRIIRFPLTVPWDITTLQNSDQVFITNPTSSLPRLTGMFIRPDTGKTLYTIDRDDDVITQWDLPDNWSLTGATSAGTWPLPIGAPRGLWFKDDDGTSYYVVASSPPPARVIDIDIPGNEPTKKTVADLCATTDTKTNQCATTSTQSDQCITTDTQSDQCITSSTKSDQCITESSKEDLCV